MFRHPGDKFLFGLFLLVFLFFLLGHIIKPNHYDPLNVFTHDVAEDSLQ